MPQDLTSSKVLVSVIDFSTNKSYREGGSVLLELPMENNNNNTNTNTTVQPTITGDQSSVIGEDGPLLFALTLGQNNNNGTGPRQNNVQQCPDTLHPTNIALELEFAGENEDNDVENLPVNNDRDGPLLFVLLPDSQTDNNDSTAPGACNSEKPKTKSRYLGTYEYHSGIGCNQ
ncbi:hypothetical protein BHYA_0002g00870 [Botrytis hyacinthi]|uniref:Uncharacterized protein n=1 Tax=Botrytis hyacinthi TaxID=278943 RepID=A0A4Z1H758_9HELO|nr:hypothetical protein BHYA_0002g00870 [Botrytis hyacinthi]